MNNKDFIKLFDLNIPDENNFDYYLNQLSKTSKFKNIKDYYKMFLDINFNGDFYQYKMDKVNEVINYIKNTHAYTELVMDSNLLDLPTNKSILYKEGVNYLSVDIRSANWRSLKYYDQLNELGDSYQDFLLRFDLPQVFVHSKYLRQFIFGNVNPKRQQKVQRNMIQEVVRTFSDDLFVEGVRNDEVIFRFDDFDDVNLESLDLDRYSVKFFSVERVEDFRVDTLYDYDGDILSKELSGVSGQEFYLKLKQYITSEDIDERDLIFKHNGKLAKWWL
jgi:hypothetical protein